jgi:hypothetical protein
MPLQSFTGRDKKLADGECSGTVKQFRLWNRSNGDDIRHCGICLDS